MKTKTNGAPANFLVVDVGASTIKWSVASEGSLGKVHRIETKTHSADALLNQLFGVHSRASGIEPLPWALCIAGLVDAAHGRVIRSGNLGLKDEPIFDRLADLGAPPRFVVNDLTAAAAGEAAGGTMALLQVGSGLGGRIVVAGAVVSGVHGYGGELGHLVFVPSGRPCTCGLLGCIEAYAGMTAFRTRYRELGRTLTSPQQIIDDAAVDREAGRILEEALRAISFAAAVLVSASDPGIVRLGGGLAAAWGERLRAAVERGVSGRVPPELSRGTRVQLSKLRDRAPLLGLLYLAHVAAVSNGRQSA